MNVKLEWDGRIGFNAATATGQTVKMDLPTESGGSGSGPLPLELVLFGLGGCSGMDVVSILAKMKQQCRRLTIEVQAERATEHPKRLTKAHLVWRLSGPALDPAKINHAIELSLTKYCSVAASLNLPLTYELIIE